LSCYSGYILSGTTCMIQTDLNCKSYQGSICLQCYSGYFINSNSVCTVVNSLCKTSNMTNGACIDCYQGYIISSNTCIVAFVVTIPYCSMIVGTVCSSCVKGYYVSNGACRAVSILCNTYNMSNGFCTTCYAGYVLQSAQCIYPSLGVDKNCAWYTNSYCTQCSTGFILINYWCHPIDPNCLQFDYAHNVCQVCTSGKKPSGQICI